MEMNKQIADLDKKIQEVMFEAQNLDLDLSVLGISTTNDANLRLVEMETEAFEKVRSGNKQEAYGLLSSTECSLFS